MVFIMSSFQPNLAFTKLFVERLLLREHLSHAQATRSDLAKTNTRICSHCDLFVYYSLVYIIFVHPILPHVAQCFTIDYINLVLCKNTLHETVE